MARAILVAAAVGWILLGLGGIGLALVGTDAVRGVLPPLAIGADALSRTVAALAIAALVLGVTHAVIGVGLGRGTGWAASAGLLLCGVSIGGFVTLATAALTAGAAGSMVPAGALAAAAGALLVAAGYGVAASSLVHRLRGRRPI